ncbi:protein jag [Pseudanabaena sp. PCC 6802]|uniref:Jag family protein n=1 Tax=Pseudanabaena sp. PCC 6802 TaxID=118173 RepID=UPI0003499045|nr:R3H domain-containing nucleic acid-binding protein [Pseudanabaena sp. PCC 6802]
MQQTDKSCDWLKQLLDLMGYPTQVKAIPAPIVDPNSTDINVWLEIDRSNLNDLQIQMLLGRDGSNLDAIQSLANLYLNLGKESEGDRHFYTIELNGYRAEQQARLKSLAESAASQVRQTHQDCQIKHLSPAERRIVHMLLKECPDLETFSEGVEPHRYLIVRALQT